MPKLIDKKTLEYLAGLSRIKLEENEEEQILKDLQKILDYFDLLKEADVSRIEPLAGGLRLAEGSLRPAEGGTIETNVLRRDEKNERRERERGKLIDSFSEKQDDFLKIPPVF